MKTNVNAHKMFWGKLCCLCGLIINNKVVCFKSIIEVSLLWSAAVASMNNLARIWYVNATDCFSVVVNHNYKVI